MRQKFSFQFFLKTLVIAFLAGLFLLFPFSGTSGILIFVAVIAFTFMLPTPQRRFMRYQKNLPTSKVRSMASGLVELEGKLVSQKMIRAPMSGKHCIGFYHTVTEKEHDTHGQPRYRLVHEEKQCSAFALDDGTGKAQIVAENLDFYLLPVSEEKHRGRQISREYRLEAGEEYLLIGQAVRRDNQIVIRRDSLRRVFGIAPVHTLKRRGKLNVLLGRARYYCVATALFIALILGLPVDVQHRQVVIHYSQLLPFLDVFSSLSDSSQ
ncbi:hypothetical protein HV127_14440 [Klebsiella sp. RHBSTW-00215]|uniref:hypothetical protein n=1 Tax=Klebsiella sp. RHBSTW-00215 TaxID=2742640 RepID=UPI0015F5628A|nr:hypothetical protein [Klebsiella sp. RHBSTW-00215]MBA7932440.1 hypothetical protein [Klebsiella sp. RHBSTW-00215]